MLITDIHCALSLQLRLQTHGWMPKEGDRRGREREEKGREGQEEEERGEEDKWAKEEK